MGFIARFISLSMSGSARRSMWSRASCGRARLPSAPAPALGGEHHRGDHRQGTFRRATRGAGPAVRQSSSPRSAARRGRGSASPVLLKEFSREAGPRKGRLGFSDSDLPATPDRRGSAEPMPPAPPRQTRFAAEAGCCAHCDQTEFDGRSSTRTAYNTTASSSCPIR